MTCIAINGDAREMCLDRFDRYWTIVCDPPWFYNDRRPGPKRGCPPRFGFGASNHYESMSVNQICNMPVRELCADRCHLYLWATCPLLPDALRVLEAWGFKWATVAFVWVKANPRAWVDAQSKVWQTSYLDRPDATVRSFLDALTFFGPGFYTASNVELVLLGTRGQPFYHAPGCKASQVIYAPRGAHSAKPDAVQDMIEWMYPHATPRLELFARRPRNGWTVFGDEVDEEWNV